MKKTLLISLILFELNTFAQTEILKCESIDPNYKLELFRITTDNLWKNYKPTFPLLLFYTTNFQKIQKLHLLIISQKNEISELKKRVNYYSQLVYQNDTLVSIQDKRVELYQKSYNQLLDINKQLSNQFDKVYDLSLTEAKKSKVNGVIYGILSGLVAGITIGVIIK